MEVPPEIVREIRERIDIVEIISQTVDLKRAGTNFKGLCPFHQEKSPSFTVNPAKQLFYCFGCQVGGDVITFQKILTNQNYIEIIKDFASRVGVTLPEKPLSAQEQEERIRRQNDLSVMNWVQDFFVKNLDRHEPAKRSVLSRGYEETLLSKEGLGYSGSGWEDVVSFLQKKKVSLERAALLGLVAKRDGGGFYDRFRERLTFPIRNADKEIVGFGGRTLKHDDPAKYLNSPETPLYKKSFCLYRLGEAKEAIRKQGFVILTEGYFDALAFVAAGFSNAVACCGTAFTLEQARMIKRYGSKVFTAFDGDQAGTKATIAAFPLLIEAGLQHAVIEFPAEEDPDSFRQKKGVTELQESVKTALPIMEFLLKRLVEHGKKGVQEKTKAIARMDGYLRILRSPVEQELYRQQAANLFGINVSLFVGSSPEKKVSYALRRNPSKPQKASTLTQEEVFVGILLQRPELSQDLNREQIANFLTDPCLKVLALDVVNDYEQFTKVETGALLERYPQIPALVMRTSEYTASDMVGKIFQDCVQGLRRNHVTRLMERLTRDLQEAESRGNQESARELLLALQGVIQKQREMI